MKGMCQNKCLQQAEDKREALRGDRFGEKNKEKKEKRCDQSLG